MMTLDRAVEALEKEIKCIDSKCGNLDCEMCEYNQSHPIFMEAVKFACNTLKSISIVAETPLV